MMGLSRREQAAFTGLTDLLRQDDSFPYAGPRSPTSRLSRARLAWGAAAASLGTVAIIPELGSSTHSVGLLAFVLLLTGVMLLLPAPTSAPSPK